MKVADISAAIYTRLAADVTLVNTHLGSSDNIIMGQLPKEADATGNILAYRISGDGNVDTSTNNIAVISIVFDILIRKNGAQGASSGPIILDRLYGDGANPPSYGFHRYKLPLSGAVASTHDVLTLNRVNFEQLEVENPEDYAAFTTAFAGYIQTL